jgi:DNA polymerase-3 subunit alpha
VLLPAFPLPKGFDTQIDYLRHLTYEGAKKRYDTITPAIKERLDFELSVIAKTGYPGYFLIVQDFTTTAREMGVSVGPGRGSAAGSAVSYCIGITSVDPIKYDLLFERFLNPERISMPDIDIDFDDVGRQKVIDYVIDKYGRNQVAQIVTYGTMAAKSSLRDVGRVMDVPLSDVDRVAKTFPVHLSATLNKVLADKDVEPGLKGKLLSDDIEKAYQFRELAEQEDEIGQMIRTAKKLEGNIRNTGIHACGVVITPGDITQYVPVKTDKGSDMLVTQFDNSVAEDAGLLKMDFLGLKTLSIIKDAVRMVKERFDVDIDPELIPLDDEKTYELFQRGETIAIFQYESSGMQKYMKELKPTEFADLIAMNALYRPGPLEYIPEFIDRKHGRKPVIYDLDAMEEYLAETYGICVYQEQVMLLSQKLANFTKGQADKLRKGMGKKKKSVIDPLYPLFIEGGENNGHDKATLDKVWKDWEAFASYAFNKSHSTCYAYVAFQTAYLKAHYPAEFMASVLTHNKNDISKVTFFLKECKRMGLTVLGPDVNESMSDFSVNADGAVRFGMAALRGVGEGPVEVILEERNNNGVFSNIFDMARRLNLSALNKRVMESLVLGGAMDAFNDYHRAQYFVPSDKYDSMLEHILKYGAGYQHQKAQAANSLFGGSEDAMIPEPPVPACEKWSLIEMLNKEREVTGIYITGHPLDDYRVEVENFTNCSLDSIENHHKSKEVRFAGVVSKAEHRISRKGTGWGRFTVQDYNGSYEFVLFKDDYADYRGRLEEGTCVFVKGHFEPNWNDDGVRFKLNEVNTLESITEKMGKQVTLDVPVEHINRELLDALDALCKEYKGNQPLKVVLIDRQHRNKLELKSNKRSVTVNTAFAEALDGLGLAYKLK